MSELCGGQNTSTSSLVCATHYEGGIPSCATGNGTLTAGDVVVAVKTYRGFHSTRVPILKETLEKEIARYVVETAESGHNREIGVQIDDAVSTGTTSILKYFSDLKDDSIPTQDLGVENTQRGHCAKTMAIMRYYAKEVYVESLFLGQWRIPHFHSFIIHSSIYLSLVFAAVQMVGHHRRRHFNVVSSSCSISRLLRPRRRRGSGRKIRLRSG